MPSRASIDSAQARLEAQLAEARAALAAGAASQRESQAYFEKSFHNNPALMSIARASDGRIIEVNPAFVRACGYAHDEIVGRTTLELGLWVNLAQRDAFLHRIRTEHVVRDLQADFRAKDGSLRTLLLNADVIELGGQPCMLTVGVDVSERVRRDKIQSAIYAISQAVLGGNDLPALLAKLHRIIADLMPARNFYVALLNADRTILSFPYFVDETTPHPEARPPRNGLTEYVINSAQPLRATEAQVIEIVSRQGKYIPTGKPSAQWLGAPLLVEGRSIGVIAVQDYHSATAYTEEDERLLMFVASQTAAAIHHQQVEAAQREVRTYFEKSFQLNPAVMMISNANDGRIIEVNPAFTRATGYTREEAVGRSTLDLRIWVDMKQRNEMFAQLRRNGVIRDTESQLRHKRGRTLTLVINADPIELGGQQCLLTVGMDITERRRREQVQAATFRISQLVLAGGDLSALFAEVHRIIAELMPARNFYVARLSADGRTLSFPYFVDEHVTPPKPRPLGNGFTEYVLHTGKPARITRAELPDLLRARGAYQPVDRPAAQRIGVPLLSDGRAIGVIALQDYDNASAYEDDDVQLLNFVAEQTAAALRRREAETALARAEERYRGIFENAVEGLYLSSPEGRFLSANPALAHMLGYATPAEMLAAVQDIRRNLYVRSDRRDDFFAAVHPHDQINDFESEVFRADGSHLWISESVRVVRNAQGAIDHFEGVAIDITARREAARALEAAKEAADAASRAKSYFLASVSHELRTPLNGILGYTQILRRDPSLGERQREGVGVIHESADHLLALINDVLDLSKIEAGRIELHPADFDLPEFAAGVERAFMPRAKEKSILFESAVALDLPRWVRGDEQRLRQIVFNLVSNAVKFTKAGGVVFSVQRVDAEGIRFSVSDTGPGIAAEDLGKLFEPFSQVGNKATAAATGTGLGLAISRSLVERMNGRLNVESKPGWGSRFWFDVTLPVASAAAPTPASAARRVVGYDGRRRRILVVDDNAANRSVMVDMLAPLGFEVAEAADGERALAEAQRFKPDLVLMDLRLPGKIDGLEATRRLRASEALDPGTHGRTPIIAVSASAYDFDRTECFTAGCDDFLAKPFREEALWAIVARSLALTWQTADPGETRSPFPLVVQAPPPTEAAAIYELAAKGDVVGIRYRAQELIVLDAKYAPFAQSVLDLAARFKMKAIRQFVARYMQDSLPHA